MKHSFFKFCVYVFLSFKTIFAYGEMNTLLSGNNDVESPARDYNNFNSVSAQVTDMFRYGEFQTSLFTGRLQQTIPIYTIEDPDFKMDIALHYNAEGFKPRKHSGYVGYNWFLEAGGCITREVKGFPDEIYGRMAVNYGSYYDMGIEGMYHFIALKKPGWNKSKDDIFALPFSSQSCVLGGSGEFHNVGDICDDYVDYTPDIFHFNFLGYNGKFIINNEGKVKIISGDYIDIDLSKILTDWEPRNPDRTPDSAFPMSPNKNSTITVKTKDGYTYIFGGDLSKLEYTVDAYNWNIFLYKNLQEYCNSRFNPPTVSTWHLAQIIAPNKRTVTFHYKPAVKSKWFDILGDETPESIPEDVPGIDDPLWEFNESFDRFSWYFNAQAAYCDQINEYIYYNPAFNNLSEDQMDSLWCALNSSTPPYTRQFTYYMYSATKNCILDSITISGAQPLSVVFGNSLETTEMYNYATHYGENRKKNFQLDSVRVLSAGNSIKTAKLSYEYKGFQGNGYSFNWRFLSSVSISGVGDYHMSYYNGSFPDLYLNAMGTNAKTYDYRTGRSAETDDYGYYVNSNHSLALLQKIIYPTGGEQTFVYGKYAYDKKRKYSIEDDSYLEMNTINENGILLGARINEVKTFEKGNLVETKTYSYSDGVYFDNHKVYNMYFIEELAIPEYGWPVQCDANYDLLDTHIGYGKVTETTTNTQGTFKTVYQFDTGSNSYSSRYDTNINGSYECEGFNNLRISVLVGKMFYSSQLSKWGKLISIDNFKSDNHLLSSHNYEYNSLSHYCTDTIVVFGRYYLGQAEIAQKLYIVPDFITQEIVKTYSQNDSLIITKSYSYDKKLRLKHETITDSRDISHFTKYTYPDEINVSDDDFIFNPNALSLLRRSNRISEPIETVSGYMENNHEYLTSGKINLYTVGSYLEYPPKSHHAPSHNPVVPDWLDSISYPGGGIRDSLIESVVMIQQYPYLHKTLSLSMTEPIADYQAMGANGSIVTYDDRYALDMEYVFDPMGRPTFVKPFGASATTYTWEGIYPKTKSVGKQKYTYTYIPYVGISSVTDPRGITTYYTYDANGRLVETYQIVNGKKQILNAYRYHVKSELL